MILEYSRKCLQCGVPFDTNSSRQIYCSHRCARIPSYKKCRLKYLAYQKSKREIFLRDRNLSESVECLECGLHFLSLIVHVKKRHGMTIKEYRDKHNKGRRWKLKGKDSYTKTVYDKKIDTCKRLCKSGVILNKEARELGKKRLKEWQKLNPERVREIVYLMSSYNKKHKKGWRKRWEAFQKHGDQAHRMRELNFKRWKDPEYRNKMLEVFNKNYVKLAKNGNEK